MELSGPLVTTFNCLKSSQTIVQSGCILSCPHQLASWKPLLMKPLLILRRVLGAGASGFKSAPRPPAKVLGVTGPAEWAVGVGVEGKGGACSVLPWVGAARGTAGVSERCCFVHDAGEPLGGSGHNMQWH